MQWHQLDYMQTICTSLQTDNHTVTLPLDFYGRMLFLTPNKQCQSTEGNTVILNVRFAEQTLYHSVHFG